MYKQELISYPTLFTKKYCDVCNKEIDDNVPISIMSGICAICSRDLCEDCISDVSYNGGYVFRYCEHCRGIGDEFRVQIKKLDDEKELLKETWRSTATRKLREKIYGDKTKYNYRKAKSSRLV